MYRLGNPENIIFIIYNKTFFRSKYPINIYFILKTKTLLVWHADGGDVEAALKGLSELKGVGVATASAVLSTRDDSIPFMSDEAMQVCVQIQACNATVSIMLQMCLDEADTYDPDLS